MKIIAVLVLMFTIVKVESRDRLGMSFQPKFECDARCMARIGLIVQREIGKVTIDDLEAHSVPVRERRDSAESTDICIPKVRTIDWKLFIERDLCVNIKARLPQCKGRLDSCISCFGNGTYGKLYLM